MADYDDDDDDGLVQIQTWSSFYLLCTWLQHSQTGSDKDEESAATWESICFFFFLFIFFFSPSFPGCLGFLGFFFFFFFLVLVCLEIS